MPRSEKRFAASGVRYRTWCQRIAQKRLPIAALGPLFISHLHVDHIGEFANYLITSWIEGRRTPLKVYGPPGTSSIVETPINSVYERDIAFRTQGETAFGPFIGAEVTEVRGGQVIEGDGWTVRCEEVEHGHKLPFETLFRQRWICLSFRVEAEGKISYSGDAVMCDELVRAAKDADRPAFAVLLHGGVAVGQRAYEGS